MQLLIETNDTSPFNKAGLFYAKPIDKDLLQRFIVKLILSYRLHSHHDYSEEIGEITAKSISASILKYLEDCDATQ